MGNRLIYQKSDEKENLIALRKNGHIWFLIFYVPHLIFSFFLDILFFVFENGKWVGLLLFLLKAGFITYSYIVIKKLPHTKEKSCKKNRSISDILFVSGLAILLVIDIFLISPNTPLHMVIMIGEWALVLSILVQPSSRKNRQ